MSAPAGLCEWCGGPQQWTFVRGVMYVRCRLGCEMLPFTEFAVPVVDANPVARKLQGNYREASVGVGDVQALENNPGRMPGSVHIAVVGMERSGMESEGCRGE